MSKKQKIEGWSDDIEDHMTNLDKNTDDIDEVVMTDANVHLESMSDQSAHLIIENTKHRWNFVIHTVSPRSKMRIILQETEEK